MYLKSCIFFILFLHIALQLEAQTEVSSQKCQWVKIFNEELILDTLSIDPQSIQAKNAADSLIAFDYNINSGAFTLSSETPPDSLLICYRVFPFRFYDTRFKRNLQIYDSNAFFKDNRFLTSHVSQQREQLFESEGLQKSGSITRGISLGNTQNVFVNSALNLQLDGKLDDNIFIRAAISDQNIPLQPEGNTQQLQEFDKVFIQLYNKNASLTAGDVVLRHNSSYFLKYYKNVQGGQFDANYKLGDNANATTSASASVAKGKFASILVEPIEGVSGPYRLRGAANERFIIVLANSEKVFLDGVLLQRGFNNDYTIDYNLGEITFTSKVIITQFSRIRVDFEYSDRNYSRTIMSGSHAQNIGKLDFYLNAYTEKDNPNRPLAFDLSPNDQQYLSQIGDNAALAQLASFDSIAYSVDRILYRKADTIYAKNMQTEIFIHSTNPEQAHFQVFFSEVGEGKGNYRQKKANANGRVYEWIAPVNDVLQGNYAPVRQVPLPQKKQMVNIGTAYNITDYDKIFVEAAFSENDVNLYSKLGSENDKGQAIKTGYQVKEKPLNFLNGYKLNAALEYEFTERYFNPIDRFRYIEFDRDWSFTPDSTTAAQDDHILNMGAGIEKDASNLLNYKWVKRKRGETVDGTQHMVNGAKSFGNLQLKTSLFLMHNEKAGSKSDWQRVFVDAHYKTRFIVPGYAFQSDKNSISDSNSDLITGSAMYFEEHKMYLKSHDTLHLQYDISHSIRNDQSPLEGELARNTHAQTTRFSVNSRISESQSITFLSTYRTVKHYKVPGQEKEETIMGRLDWQASLFDRLITSDFSYALSNGRELKKDFVYLQVPTGEGTHTWVDENGDGIQDLEEFYEAINFDEKNYARIFVPTDDYILAYAQNFNYRFTAEMPRSWRGMKNFKGLLSRFSNNTSLNMERKITDPDLAARLLPFSVDIEGEDVLSLRENLRSTFFFNRADPKYGFEGAYLGTKQKQLLTNGFEDQQLIEYSLNSRLNIQRIYNISLSGTKTVRSHASDFLGNRNYSISAYKVAPEIAWQPRDNIRFTGAYAYTGKQNIFTVESVEKAVFDEFSLDFRYTKVSKSTFNAIVKFIDIDFVGDENTPLGYAMLEALRPGSNFTWSLNLQQKLNRGLQLTLNYEGRKSPGADMVQIGRMQLSALF